MHGAAIAHALKTKKKRGAHEDEYLTEMLDSFLEEAPKAAASRARRIEEVCKSKMSGSTLMLDVVQKRSVKREKQIDGLIEKVEQRLSRAQSYSHLVGLAVFFVVYVIVLFMQNDVQAHYAIQASYKDSILASLPEGGLLSSANDLFDWLQEEIAERAWTEPVCGDGTCEWSPEEYPGFGRFGCIADCNRYLYTTQITVDLLPLYNASQRMLGWDLTKVNHRGREPQFKWNIWSDTMGAYLLEHDALASDGARVLEVPDGKFELRLYQTKSMADLLDISAITANRPLGPPISDTSVPRRSDSIPAFKYGDKREALASQSEMAAQVFDYCFGSIDPQNFDWQCMYPQTDQFLKIFGGYGVNGTIKMGNGSRSTANLVEVPFCGVVSDGIQGLSNHSKAKTTLIKAATTCPTSRRSGGALGGGHNEVAEAGSGQGFAPLYLSMMRRQGVQPETDVSAHAQPALGSTPLPEGESAQGRATADGGSRKILNHLPVVGTTPTPQPILTGSVGLFGECREHKDCAQGYVKDPTSGLRNWGGGPGQFCGGRGLYGTGHCYTCGDCQDNADAIDGTCPQEQCPGSGNLPACLSANKLLETWQCPDTYPFEVRRHFPTSTKAPAVAYPPKTRARYMTPFNRLVGGVLISTSRKTKTKCAASKNKVVQAFIENATTCLGDTSDSAPYGWDPVLLPTSSIYNGKVTYDSAYKPAEKAPSEFFDAAFGFFNHSYDAASGDRKAQTHVDSKRADRFLAFLDSRMTQSAAVDVVSYLRDGGFIDAQTQAVTVEWVTFNNNANIFAHVAVEFKWNEGGSIEWDFSMRTLTGPPVYRDSSHPLQVPLEVVCIVLLCVNCFLELHDLVAAVRVMRPLTYFTNLWNYLDVAHFYLMWAGWIVWVLHVDAAAKFSMEPAYPILSDPAANLRLLATNAAQEKAFLDFLGDITAACDRVAQYHAITGVSVLLFLFRIIKNLDFQERMGVVSRTIITAVPDLVHFLFIFCVVFLGFVVVGHVMFGHLFPPLSTLEGAAVEMFFWIVGYDPPGFWDPMSHAAPAWAFQIFMWTFILVVFFILFNVLLSILIDSYCEIKGSQDPQAPGFLEELAAIARSVILDLTVPHSRRLPDYKLLEVLEQHKAGLPSTNVLKQALSDSMAEPDPVILPGGVQIDAKAMRQLLLHGLDGRAGGRTAASKVEPSQDGDEKDAGDEWRVQEEDDEEEIKEDEAELLADLVKRYAAEGAAEADKAEDDTMFLLRVEHLQRELSMFRAAQHLHANVADLEKKMTSMAQALLPPDQQQQIEKPPESLGHSMAAVAKKNKLRGLLRVTVVEARGLPKMDLFRSTDAYCLVFLSEPYGESVTGAVTFRTETVQNSLEPVWNADMELPIMPGASALTVAVFDYDSLTEDDLVGVVHVHLAELDVWVQQDKWFKVHNHKMDDKRLKDAEVHLKITRLPDAEAISNTRLPSVVRAVPSMQEDLVQ